MKKKLKLVKNASGAGCGAFVIMRTQAKIKIGQKVLLEGYGGIYKVIAKNKANYVFEDTGKDDE